MCAIFGVGSHKEASKITYLGLHALQHRGQEGAGIVSTTDGEPHVCRRKGHVAEVFTESALNRLHGSAAIGHTRYSTTGGNTMANLQPLLMKSSFGWVGIAHNGNLVNAAALTQKLEAEGSIFQSTNDTEVIIHLMARSRERDPERALIEALRQVEGAYSLLVLVKDKLIAVRDPYGFRPLVLGEFLGGPVFASETTAFDLVGAAYKREIAPGEMVVVPLEAPKNMVSTFPFEKTLKRRCVFEAIYFARPDSVLYDQSVHTMRKDFGRVLADEHPALGADVVIPVPDSGVPAAIGFAERSGIPFDMGIIRSHYIGRTFIEPGQAIRDFGVKLKLNPVREAIQGKKVVVVDDSLVRGTTSKKLIKHLRDTGGAKEVHVRISAPPTAYPCFYGIDTPTRSELLASSHSIEKIRDYIGADSLGYLSLDGLLKSISLKSGEGFCHACFSGEYPTPI
ncbi:MAG: amidophosphoribosyltransferase [Deltaproteobacteria bacterium]|nr:amidophosphoribosyltransferase [Deltaproteobacteria bacterium]MBI3293115.1 amidophosphoribosyltransferase [Deltaproteobacteria bacterium]